MTKMSLDLGIPQSPDSSEFPGHSASSSVFSHPPPPTNLYVFMYIYKGTQTETRPSRSSELLMEDDYHHNSSPSLKQILKSPLCCFRRTHHRHHHLHDDESPSSEPKARLVRSASFWQKSPELKDKCRNFISRIGATRNHHRRHSADFKYDALSYALNFEDDGDRRSVDFPPMNFSSRLPASPPSSEITALIR